MTANQLAYQQLKESIRKNRAEESIKRDTLVENMRHNLITEQGKIGQIKSGISGLVSDGASVFQDESIKSAAKEWYNSSPFFVGSEATQKGVDRMRSIFNASGGPSLGKGFVI